LNYVNHVDIITKFYNYAINKNIDILIFLTIIKIDMYTSYLYT